MMNKKALAVLIMLFPVVAMASTGGGLSFAPPPTDYSVQFLSNIFGIVDGVLHGNGSQIMGVMFGIFNAAVLALGGIIITYTLMVSTVNTAHEGQMLGQKWSSMWVPVRATLGLALLIPKASGYCMMQIFFMWVVVQGVGAADKVWNAALDYLNRGGVLIQQQMNPTISILGGNSTVATGAGVILSGQVCMIGLQQILTTQRQEYLNLANSTTSGGGPCKNPVKGSAMEKFCQTPVPDFVASVNAVSIQSSIPKIQIQQKGMVYNAPMPNFDSSLIYSTLNGICGNIQWAGINANAIETVQGNITGISNSEIETVEMSRAIAVQQMYMDLSSTAQVIVNNNPTISPPNNNANAGKNGVSAFSGVNPSDQNQPATPLAQQPYGVPYLANGTPCKQWEPQNCISWGADPAVNQAPLFNGTEFQNAVADYNGIMLPTLNLMNQAQNSKNANTVREFIQTSESQGWILAGSYYFNLAYINAAGMTTGMGGGNPNNKNAAPTDTNSGLEKSTMDPGNVDTPFNPGGCSGEYENLCIWMNGSDTKITQLTGLIDGSTVLDYPLTMQANPANQSAVTNPGASTTYGFINNSVQVTLPGQPSMVPTSFVMKVIPDFHPPIMRLPKMQYDCGKMVILFFWLCLAELLGKLFYNIIIKTLFNWLMAIISQAVNYVLFAFLSVPLQGMATIFIYGVSFLQQPNVNPIIALSNMGTNYINFANELWVTLVEVAVMTAMLPFGAGFFIMALIGMAMPMLIAWVGIMVSIGFTTAYYVPFLPYMIFTFGSIGWLMAVIEAMVAAPLVALGITYPEGEGPFGSKSEQSIMILMNVFLRPALMIIGYIAAIILSYVSVWIINAGFNNVVSFIQGSTQPAMSGTGIIKGKGASGFHALGGLSPTPGNQNSQITSNGLGYIGWAGIYGFMFSIVMYTTLYLTVVQKSFGLIAMLPDKVLRWIGGQPESIGQETMGWTGDAEKKIGETQQATSKAEGQRQQALVGQATGEIVPRLKNKAPETGSTGGSGGGSTPIPPPP